MARASRKRPKKASQKSAGFVDAADVPAGRVHVELPVSLAEIIGGLNDMASSDGAAATCDFGGLPPGH